MSGTLTRRHILATGAAFAAAPLVPAVAHAADVVPGRLIAAATTLDVNGQPAKVFRLSDEAGHSGLTLAPGERFRVDLENRISDRTIIHWHGQLPPWTQDGFPWPQTPPIAPATVKSYDYLPIPGTFWMHSHEGLQEQSLVTAPLIVHDAADLRQERQQIVLMLHDFSFNAPGELLAGLTGQTASSVRAMAQQTENVAAPSGSASADPNSSSMHGMMMGGMASKGGMSMTSGKRSSGMSLDLNDIDYDAFLVNDRTLADPEIVPVERSGRVRLRVINGASSSQF